MTTAHIYVSLSGRSRDRVFGLTGRRYLNIDICTDFGRKNTFVNVMYAMQHLDYECKTNWELNLKKYVVSIAGLVDIDKIASSKVYWGNKQQTDRFKSFFWLELGTWPRILTSGQAQAVLGFELAAWLTTQAKWEAQAVLVFELVAWLITDTKSTGTSCSCIWTSYLTNNKDESKSTGTSCSWIWTSYLTNNKDESTGTSCSWMRTSHLVVDRNKMYFQNKMKLADMTAGVWNWQDCWSLKLAW